MKNTFQLEKMELLSLDCNEIADINGGLFKEIGWFIGAMVGHVVNDISKAVHGTYTQSSGSAAMHHGLN